jgi:hypothetical protein
MLTHHGTHSKWVDEFPELWYNALIQVADEHSA